MHVTKDLELIFNDKIKKFILNLDSFEYECVSSYFLIKFILKPYIIIR